MFKIFKKNIYKWITAITLKSFEAISDLLLPFIIAGIVDIGIAENNMEYLYRRVMLMIAFSTFGYLSAILCNYYIAESAQSFGEDLREVLFTKIQSFTISQIEKFSQSSLITRVTKDVDGLVMVTMMGSRMVLRGVIIGIGSLVMSFYINFKLSLIFLTIIVLTVFMIKKYVKNSLSFYEKIREKLDVLTGKIREGILGIRVIRALSQEEYEKSKFDVLNSSLASETAAADNIVDSKIPFMTLYINLGVVFVLWIGGIDVVRGNIKVGEIIALINYLNMLFFSLRVLNFIFSYWGRVTTSYKRINEVLKEEIEEDQLCKTVTEENRTEEILKLENISFSFGRDTGKILDNINFTIKKGEFVGIIGSVGAGKSTMLNLIMNFYSSDSGKIYFMGRDINSYPLSELRQMIGIVFQKSFLFSQTILENMRWGDENASEDEIKEAISDSQLEEFVASLSSGYESKILKGGVNLSGGQKQRFSIARAILKKSKLLIFDDSFSALDYITESNLKKILLEKYRKKTIIIVSNKISTIMDCDKIILMENGKILGVGTHEYLMGNSSLYREICSTQGIGGNFEK